ncbi:MAG: nucleoside triphosphate pyrophosphohydrolase family protein [Candidatus Nomurabacteria bacterium]|nr:MAG: nucleoside triphosphate pyrophosphohydrolase family protein [Candidatus Nomurabacteria bacterium]
MKEYGEKAISTLTSNHAYGSITPDLMAQVLGLVGESGEVAEKFKKLVRDKGGEISEEDRQELLKELGDILWYVNAVSVLLGSSLEETASKNLEKVLSRKARGKTHGSGDNR